MLLAVPPPSLYQEEYKESKDSTDNQLIPATNHHSVRRSISEEMMEGYEMDMSHSDDCVDSPLGWYDLFGRNCEWYAEDNKMNCELYGSSFKNFGKTAMQACCTCGETGTMMKEDLNMTKEDLNMTDMMTEDEMTSVMMENMNSTACWDMPDWYDTTGYGCDWYAEGENCDMYGEDYMGMGNMSDQSASSACCACGGGQSFPPSMMEKNNTSMPGCSESPYGWTDDQGFNCAWYGAGEDRCSDDVTALGLNNKTANEACCECKGSEKKDEKKDENAPDASSGGTARFLSSSVIFCSTLSIAMAIALV